MLNKISGFGLSEISKLLSFSRVATSFCYLPFSKLSPLLSLNKFCLYEEPTYIWDVDSGDQGYINTGGGIQKI